MVRCFVALELPDPVKKELAGVQERFSKKRISFLRWVNPEGIHITLKFLGEIPEERIPDLVKAIQDAAAGMKPFELELDGLGVFPTLSRTRIFWAGIGGDVEMLKTLQRNVDVSFALLGFEEEAREFTAHLTLARVKDEAAPEQRKALGELVSRSTFEPGTRFKVDSVNLIRSVLRPTGAVYTRLATIPLTST